MAEAPTQPATERTTTKVASSPLPKPTPTRQTPRINMQSTARISSGRNLPVTPCLVLNVSKGGALIFSGANIEPETIIQVELGPPIFPIARLVSATVKHVDPAPDHLLLSLRTSGKIPAKSGGYLLGVKFNEMTNEQQQTLLTFIQKHVREEQQRRAATKGEDGQAVRTALNRKMRLEKPRLPAWVYAAALLVGAFEIVAGIFTGSNESDIAWHAAVPMALIWVVGRITMAVYLQLDDGPPAETEIVATLSGMETNIDEVLADADSELDKAPPVEPDSADEANRSLVSSGLEVVAAAR